MNYANSPFGPEALSFDDVLLMPGYSEVLPSQVDLSTTLAPGIHLKLPILSAAMDTVTEARLAIALARQGGLGVIHRNLRIADQAAEVDKAVAQRTWHIGVDFGNDDAGGIGSGFGCANFDAKATKAVFVGGRNGDEGNVDGQNAVAEEAGDFGEEDGGKVGASLLNGRSHIMPNKQRIDPKALLILWLDIGSRGKGQNMSNFDIAQFVSAADEPL